MKRSILRGLRGKDATILNVSDTLTSQTRVMLYQRIVSQRRDVLIVRGFVHFTATEVFG